MTVFDAGALVALERADRRSWVRLKAELQAGTPPRTHGGVVGQVWRGGAGHQARLARALQGFEVVPIDDRLGRRTGLLLARAGTADVIDAALVAMTELGDSIITSDVEDLRALVLASRRDVKVLPV